MIPESEQMVCILSRISRLLQREKSTPVLENTVERLWGAGGRKQVEVDHRGDKGSHIPNGSIYKRRILRIQGIVTIHLLDFERPDEVHEEAINSGLGEVSSGTLPTSGSASFVCAEWTECGTDRRPNPKMTTLGSNWPGASALRKRSGLNDRGSGHTLGSLSINLW